MRTALTALKLFLAMTALTGFAYPLLVTGYARAFHKEKAAGSLVYAGGRAAGSALLAQKFTGAGYFHPRPSAVGYNIPSGGSNLSPASAALRKLAAERAAAGDGAFPEMTQASASGLDPHISPEAAMGQAERVALARGAAKVDIISLVSAMTEDRTFGVLGEPRVNVLELNLELDKRYPYGGK